MVQLGTVLVLAGTFLGLIFTLSAVGSGIQVHVLPGRRVTAVAKLGTTGGRVVVQGRAEAGPAGTYQAPLSGAECVWYLASRSRVAAAVGGDDAGRSTVDRYPDQPFTLVDPAGNRVLVGPRCPALEQIPPSFRSVGEGDHPWFGAAAEASADDAESVEVYEFVVTAGTALVAAGDLTRTADGTPHLDGDVVLSALPAAAEGDPARARFRRDVIRAVIGWALVILGALLL